MRAMRRGDEGGFTLVELLVVVVLLGVVGSVVITGLVRGMRTSQEVQQRIAAMAELQVAAERIAREFRAACPVTDVAADDATVMVVRDGARWNHRFYLDGGALIHSSTDEAGAVALSPRPLVTDLDTAGTAFEFFDREGDAVTSLPSQTLIQSARITLSRDLPQARPLEVVTQVTLRNGGRSCD